MIYWKHSTNRSKPVDLKSAMTTFPHLNNIFSTPQSTCNCTTLVEVTVTRCILAIYDAASDADRWTPADLSDRLLEEWARLKADTDIALNEDNRRQRAVNLCRHLIGGLPVSWPGKAHLRGNWDDGQIERMSARLGCELQISAATAEAVKRPIRDDLGQLALIRDRRNGLAHGNLSFAECGADVTIDDLRSTKDCTVPVFTRSNRRV